MDRHLAEKLVEALEHDGEEPRLFEDYSGRGMCGERTCGVVCESVDTLLESVVRNASLFVDDAGDPLFSRVTLRMDNLGRQTIIY